MARFRKRLRSGEEIPEWFAFPQVVKVLRDGGGAPRMLMAHHDATCMQNIYNIGIHTCIHTYIHAYIHTYMHTYIHACIHTYIHAYIHTYIHTYVDICL